MTQDEWRITPCDNGDYLMTRPGDNQPWMRCYPSDNWRVELVGQPRRLDLQEWHLARQRMITLVECARTADRSLSGQQVDYEGIQTDTVCTNCGKNPDGYQGWGMFCQDACGGHYMPVGWEQRATGKRGKASVPSQRIVDEARRQCRALAKDLLDKGWTKTPTAEEEPS
jgi:hypothetical protein